MLLDLQHLIPRKIQAKNKGRGKENLQPTVTLLSVAELVRWNADCLFPKFDSCEYSPNHPNESGLRLSRVDIQYFSGSTFKRARNCSEIRYRVSKSYGSNSPAQIEACMDSNGGCFCMIFWTVERGRFNDDS
ncbi:hypothetical protein TNCV_1069141 [Trichonephila clavipes]|nr:hypothetical protein TNCV_1069141 [Trichonephila clavipes]